MSIFRKKKKKKTEEINLVIEETTFEDEEEIEKEEEIKQEEIEQSKTDEELINEIISLFHHVDSKNERVEKENITNKILSRVGLRDLDFNMQVLAMDKHIDRLKKDCFDLKRTVENIKSGLILERPELEKLHKQLVDLTAFQTGILNQLNEVKNATFGQLKISTVAVTMNKSNEELTKLYDNISIELKGFKSFEEASEYIFYNSGSFLDDLTTKLIRYIKGTKNKEYIDKYNKTYFLGSDVVISLEIKEWIDLYNKLKFVLRQVGSYDKKNFDKFLELYDTFEAKYAILMMRTESKRG